MRNVGVRRCLRSTQDFDVQVAAVRAIQRSIGYTELTWLDNFSCRQGAAASRERRRVEIGNKSLGPSVFENEEYAVSQGEFGKKAGSFCDHDPVRGRSAL